MYQDVIRYLYSEHFDLLFSPEIKEVIILSRDKEMFTNSVEIEGGYYVEGSLSANRIVKKLQKIYEILELEDILDLRVSFRFDGVS